MIVGVDHHLAADEVDPHAGAAHRDARRRQLQDQLGLAQLGLAELEVDVDRRRPAAAIVAHRGQGDGGRAADDGHHRPCLGARFLLDADGRPPGIKAEGLLRLGGVRMIGAEDLQVARAAEEHHACRVLDVDIGQLPGLDVLVTAAVVPFIVVAAQVEATGGIAAVAAALLVGRQAAGAGRLDDHLGVLARPAQGIVLGDLGYGGPELARVHGRLQLVGI